MQYVLIPFASGHDSDEELRNVQLDIAVLIPFASGHDSDNLPVRGDFAVS